MTAPSTGPNNPGNVRGRAIPTHEFTIVAHGYDPDQVRAYVAHVRAEVARLERDNWELRRRLDTAERAEPRATLVALREDLERAMARFEQVEAARRAAVRAAPDG